MIKFEESSKIITNIYSKIEDENIKSKVDILLKNVSSQIEFTNYQIKNRFEYKKQAGFAMREEEKKIDYLMD